MSGSPVLINALKQDSHSLLLGLRLCTLVLLVALLTVHMRSVRVFRWEQSVTGGVLVTYCVALPGLALCAGDYRCGALSLQVYLSGLGAILLAVNAATIWRRWRTAGELTRVIAELLQTMGIPLEKHVKLKVWLSVLAALTLLLDLALTPLLLG